MHVRQVPFRLLRAVVFAVVTVAGSALLHVWGGGAAPESGPFAAAIVPTVAVAYAVGGRQRGFIALAPLCLVSQWGLHEFFSFGSPAVHDHGSGVAMVLVHVAAAFAQAAWLARGDAALAALLDLFTLFCARVLRLRPARAFTPTLPWAAPLSTPRPPEPLTLVTCVVSRRGPPAPAL